MPSRDAELARRLLRNADGDRVALRKLAPDAEVIDVVVGFHAQQAVEKYLKAVLTASGIEYEYLHDLPYLTGLLESRSVELPPEIREAEALTRWAVEFRYGEEPDQPLDRPEAIRLVDGVRAWAEGLVS